MNEIDSFFLNNASSSTKFYNLCRVPITEIIDSEVTSCISPSKSHKPSRNITTASVDKQIQNHSLELNNNKRLCPSVSSQALIQCENFICEEKNKIVNYTFSKTKQANCDNHFNGEEITSTHSYSTTSKSRKDKPKCIKNLNLSISAHSKRKKSIDSTVLRTSNRIKNKTICNENSLLPLNKVPKTTNNIATQPKPLQNKTTQNKKNKTKVLGKDNFKLSFRKERCSSNNTKAQEDETHLNVDTACDISTKCDLYLPEQGNNQTTLNEDVLQRRSDRIKKISKPVYNEKELSYQSKTNNCNNKIPKKVNRRRKDEKYSNVDNKLENNVSNNKEKPTIKSNVRKGRIKTSDQICPKETITNKANIGKGVTLKYLKQRQDFLKDQIDNREEMDIFESVEKNKNEGLYKLFEMDLNDTLTIKTPKDKDKFNDCFSGLTPRSTLLSELGKSVKTPPSTFTPSESSRSEQKQATQILYRHLKDRKPNRKKKKTVQQLQLNLAQPLKTTIEELPVLLEEPLQHEDSSFDDYFEETL